MTTYNVPSISERAESKLKGDCKEYAERIGTEGIKKLMDMRQKYIKKNVEYREAIEVIAANNRIKNKRVDYENLADLIKGRFNALNIDYYLFRLGFNPVKQAMAREGAEYILTAEKDNAISMLISLGYYNGFNYIHYTHGCGRADLVKSESTDIDDGKYTREDLGILLV